MRFSSFQFFVFGDQAPPDVMREIKEEKITINFHEHCLTPANFTRWTFWTFLTFQALRR